MTTNLTISATGTDFYRAFASRVRETLATEQHTRTTDTAPATFQAAPDAPCEHHTWCVETGQHIDHFSQWVSLPATHGLPPILTANFYTDEPTGTPTLDYDPGHDDWREYTTGDQLRAETAKVRAHLVRLDALADQYDAIREAGADGPQSDSPATRTTRALTSAMACVAEHGATPEQVRALGIIARFVIEDGDPDGAGRQLANTLTAEVRGPEWMAEYGCTPICVMDHTDPQNNPGWHQGPEGECPVPGTLCSELPGECDEPLIAARVTTVNDTPEIFGIRTTLWVDVPGDTMELSLPEVDKFITGLEGFLPQLRVLRAQLAEAVKGDIPVNEEAKARWRAEQDARAAAERAEIAHQATEQDGGAR